MLDEEEEAEEEDDDEEEEEGYACWQLSACGACPG
jgi:hypothetical protein